MPRGGTNYIPRPDSAFAAWAAQYAPAVRAFYELHGLDLNDLKDFNTALDEWTAAYPAHVAAQAAAEGARAAKDQARVELERAVRPITSFVQSYNQTTDADRATMGITVRDTSRRPAPPPTTAPQAQVEGGTRLTHTLRLTDESTPTKRAKPKGTLGAEVWVALVDAGAPTPTNPASLSFLTLATKPSITTQFKAADGGKTAVYMLRWVSTRGEKGPWGAVVGATVAA